MNEDCGARHNPLVTSGPVVLHVPQRSLSSGTGSAIMSFEIIPAIDLLDGAVVRLSQGRREFCTVYSADPVGQARKFAAAGARRLHIVDLNGAFDGALQHLDIVRDICRHTPLTVELGGGIRTREAAESVWEAGVDDVILGTKAVEDADLLQELIKARPCHVVVGIDARDGRVATRGWIQTEGLDALDFALRLQDFGCRRIIYTDISTDGMLKGPNLDALRRMAATVPDMEVIASGGVSRVDDLVAIKNLGLTNIVGSIVGKAIYDGQLDLASAVQTLKP